MRPSCRRTFLKASAAVVTSAVACRSAMAAGPVGVRKDVTLLTAAELDKYRQAVKRMTELPETDPRTWTKQAQIHQNSCPHGNWFFLPWHRAYLMHFENICRKLLSDDTFMLPYWNWTTTPRIPSSFWEEGSPLNHARDITSTGEVPAEYVGRSVIDAIMAIPDFVTFGSGPAPGLRMGPRRSGQLESVPHNNVHMELGGDMASFMSPLDPIFWLHHANCDRIWAEWAQTHSNPADEQWLKLPMKFVDGTGAAVESKPEDVLDVRELGYRYDTQPEMPLFLSARPFSVRVEIPAGLTAAASFQDAPPVVEPKMMMAAAPMDLRKLLSNLPSNPETPRPATFRLVLGGVEPPEGGAPVSIRVFINCDYLTPQTPISDPHYVSSFTFFGEDHEHDEHAGADSVRYLDATAVFRRLYGGREYPREDIEVALVTVDLRTQKPKEQHLTARRVKIEAVTKDDEMM